MEILAIGLSILGIALGLGGVIWAVRLQKRFTASLGGVSVGSLEQNLSKYHARVASVDSKLDELISEYERLSVTNSLASQKISIVRFNPFGDTGGDQSFSLAVLDAHDSGYVLTSIHGREGTRVYVKPVDFGQSKYTLSSEEQQALSQAAKRIPQINKPKKEQSRGTKK